LQIDIDTETAYYRHARLELTDEQMTNEKSMTRKIKQYTTDGGGSVRVSSGG